MKRHKLRTSIVSGTLAAVMLLQVFSGEQAKAATSHEIQKQIDVLEEQDTALQEKLDEIEGKIARNASETEELVKQKNLIDEQIVLLHQQTENANAQIGALAVLMADKQAELEAAEIRLKHLREKHKARIRAMEEQQELRYWTVLFRSSSFSEFLDRVNMIREIAEADQRRLREMREVADQIETARQALADQKAAQEEKKQELEESEKKLGEKRTQADGLLQALVAKGEEYALLLSQSEAEQEALMEELAQKKSEYDEAVHQEWLATSVPDPGVDVPSGSGDWITPVPYYVLTSPFGMRFHPLLNIWRMHNGVDMACNTNTPIYATRSGYVTVASYQEYGAGNYVQIDHGDGYRSIYMHMDRYIVGAGQYVSAGQTIGYVGTSGLSDGPHLHFGISYHGTYVNPMEYVG